MKRLTWVPIIASVVLLLIALPVFGADLITTLQPGLASHADPAMIPAPTPAATGTLADDRGEFGGGGGRGCEASNQVQNPF